MLISASLQVSEWIWRFVFTAIMGMPKRNVCYRDCTFYLKFVFIYGITAFILLLLKEPISRRHSAAEMEETCPNEKEYEVTANNWHDTLQVTRCEQWLKSMMSEGWVISTLLKMYEALMKSQLQPLWFALSNSSMIYLFILILITTFFIFKGYK